MSTLSPPYHPLDGAILKMQRAEKHLCDLRAAVRAFLDTEPYSVSVELNAEPGSHVVWAHVHRALPATLGLIVGDIAHNLRSVLDHLVWELSMMNWAAHPESVPRPNQQTQFPIFRHAPANSQSRFWAKIAAVSSEVSAVIQELQPYAADPVQAESHPLWLLNDLNIWDKHKRIPLTLASPSRVEYALRKRSGEMICGSVLLGNVALGPNSWLPFEEGAKVVTLRNTVGQAAGEPFVVDHSIVDVTVGVKVEIAFSHDTAAQYKPAVSTIEQCFATVQDALDAMAPFFPRRPESGL